MANKNDNKKPQTSLAYFLAATDELLDAMNQLSNKFSNKGSTFSIKEALGKKQRYPSRFPLAEQEKFL